MKLYIVRSGYEIKGAFKCPIKASAFMESLLDAPPSDKDILDGSPEMKLYRVESDLEA